MCCLPRTPVSFLRLSPFEYSCQGAVYVRHKDGRITGPLKASISDDRLTIFNSTIRICEGDLIERTQAGGVADRYEIVGVDHSTEFHHFPPIYDLRVKKQDSSEASESTDVAGFSLARPNGFQMSPQKARDSIDLLHEILERIDQAPGSVAEKIEAKRRLKAFLECRITLSVLGFAAGRLTALFK